MKSAAGEAGTSDGGTGEKMLRSLYQKGIEHVNLSREKSDPQPGAANDPR